MASKEYERKYIEEGYTYIAGTDEAGRGPLAGPLVVAAVVLPNDYDNPEIDDSKKVSPKKREELYNLIIEKAIAYSIIVIDVETIDAINIYAAASSIFSIKIPYPRVGSFTSTCVTAPISLPF